MPNPLPCIVCGHALSKVFAAGDRGEGPAQPADAVPFTTFGNYGSTVFDPQDESQLQINVCDGCLAVAGRNGRVWRVRHVRQPVLELYSRRWHPGCTADDPPCPECRDGHA